ncbi:Hsp70 family protein [Dactylosporangium vinaceum]|uniref:Hsp70 family protein n=1 Tax=Dactylosporangium vinaceum TaxID=53362 RepID=A0ABV5M639_9ACTN|nr:Hsp70 family protein [Dactylosporangium vinaceum]UAB97742.1 Hsp70 family protein [Dactylosporangium vinaceum]
MTRHIESQLGVDLGTTHTVAALTAADGRSQPLLFDASFLLPSSVYAEVDGHLLVGRDAERSARLDPSRFEPNPKRRIDDGTVLLGQREYAVSDLLAALLRRTADEASRVLGIMPVRTVLTYPANWATHRRSVLADAAARAGMPSPILVPEPIAAAAYFTTVLGRNIGPGGVLVVYDFGGGTFDTTILRRRPDGGWDVLASDGLPDVGGVDLDAAIVGHLGQTLTTTDPDRWRQLVEPADDAARRRNLLLRDDVRAAKEQLSRASTASIHLPLFETDIHVTRTEFEQLSRSYLQRTVDLTAGTLQRAGVRTDQIGGLFLVGGSSRIPMVSTLLHQRLGVAPTLIEQPELVVALGSVLAAMPSRPAPFPQPPPPPGPRPPVMNAPVSGPIGMPVSGPAAPVSAPPPIPVSPAAFQSATTPMSPPTSAPPNPHPTAAFGAPPPIAPPFRPVQPVRPARSGMNAGVLVAIILACVLLLGVGGVVAWNAVSDDKPDTGRTGNAGSGNGVNGGNRSTAGAGAGAVGGTKDARPGAEQQSADVNKTIWYAQFKITVGKVTYDAKASSHQLSAEMIVENLGTDNDTPYLPTVFNVGGQQYTGSFRESTTVAAGQKSNYNMDFSIYDPLKASIATGEFIFGEGDREQPKISLATGEVNAYEPANLVKDKKVTVHDVTATFTTCDVRGGFFDYNGQAKKGYRVVMCKVDIQYTGKSSLYVGQEHFRLGAPDGTEIGPLTAPNEALSSGQNAVGDDLAFQVKKDLAGAYKLRVVDLGDHKERQAGDVAEVDLVLK